MTDEELYEIKVEHTGAEKTTAMALKYRQRARAAEEMNKVLYEALDEARKDLFILAGNIRDEINRGHGYRWTDVPELIDVRLVDVRKALNQYKESIK